jgi:NAD+ diphosphatase
MNEPRFTHCPRCGASGITQPEPAAYRCSACGFFYHINPALGVGGIVQDASGQIILLRRANDPGKGMLGLPGGFVDADETAEAALHRELREEIGLEVSRFEYLGSWPNRYPFRGVTYDVVDLFFTGRTESFSAAVAKKEVDGLCILRPEAVDLAQIAFVSVRQAVAEFQRRLKDK